MTANLRQLILAAIVVQASLAAISELSSAVAFAADMNEYSREGFTVGCFAAALLLHRRQRTGPTNDLRLLLVAFLVAVGLFSTLRYIYPGLDRWIFESFNHPIEIGLGLRLVLNLTIVLIFASWFKFSREESD